MIGIVGGIGPLAGVDLYKRMVANTVAIHDQDHLPVLLASLPAAIPDRTRFLLEQTGENPAIGMAKVIGLLENAGARQIAIACNTAHAPAIFLPLLQLLKNQGSTADIINLIDITIEAIQSKKPDVQRVGLLSTSGAYKTRIYQAPLETAGLTPVLLPFERHEKLVHQVIYQIKVAGDNLEDAIFFQLNTAIRELAEMGAQSVILGCTEIGMIETKLDFGDLQVFNPNTIMARKLIELHSPHKLTVDGRRPTVDGGR